MDTDRIYPRSNDMETVYLKPVIMQGVHIGDGAIIAARAVITRDVAPYTVVGGVPAKEMRKRFDDKTITSLMEIEWWNWKYKKIKNNICAIMNGEIDNLVND